MPVTLTSNRMMLSPKYPEAPRIPRPELPAPVQGYLDAIVQASTRAGGLVSVVLFGSAAKGGFTHKVSDVDLIVVLADGASPETRVRLREEAARLAVDHGFKEAARPRSALGAFAEHAVGEDISCFVCTRANLLLRR